MADVFISYAHGDSAIADELAAELQSRGVSVFFDRGVLVAGMDFRQEIAQALSSASVVVVLLSANTKRSSWVQEELSSVIERTEGPRVIPVLLDSHAKENWVWPLVSDRHAVDLSNRQEKLSEVASRLAELIPVPPLGAQVADVMVGAIRRSSEHPPLSRVQTKTAVSVAVVLISAITLSAFFLLFSYRDQSDALFLSQYFTGPWVPIISGAIGVLVGYFVSLWRK